MAAKAHGLLDMNTAGSLLPDEIRSYCSWMSHGTWKHLYLASYPFYDDLYMDMHHVYNCSLCLMVLLSWLRPAFCAFCMYALPLTLLMVSDTNEFVELRNRIIHAHWGAQPPKWSKGYSVRSETNSFVSTFSSHPSVDSSIPQWLHLHVPFILAQGHRRSCPVDAAFPGAPGLLRGVFGHLGLQEEQKIHDPISPVA